MVVVVVVKKKKPKRKKGEVDGGPVGLQFVCFCGWNWKKNKNCFCNRQHKNRVKNWRCGGTQMKGDLEKYFVREGDNETEDKKDTSPGSMKKTKQTPPACIRQNML